jgi:transposase
MVDSGDGPFELRSRTLGALPVVQHFLDCLQLDDLLARYVPSPSSRIQIPHSVALGVLLRNIIVGRAPLYGLQEWADGYLAKLLGLADEQVTLLNDDRVGRALERLFDADRASLITAVVVRAIQVFDVDLDQFHNDSTSITFAGDYRKATGRRIRGKEALKITHGYNKDHRPDLKQLLWILTVSADGGVPIHYSVCDGNTNDDPTHIDTWNTLRQVVDHPDFLYVADSKLCNRPAMKHIHDNGGRFIAVLPRSRKEDRAFRKYVQDHRVEWDEVIRRPNPRNRSWSEDVWWVAEAPNRSAEGYRIIWLYSQLMAQADERSRLDRLQKAYDAMEVLDQQLAGPRCRLKTREAIAERVEKLIKAAGATRWANIDIIENTEYRYKQARPGRPSANTPYRRDEQVSFSLEWKPRSDLIFYDAASDGMYPLITNCEDLDPVEILDKHKYQPTLEKRHEQLKSVYAVAPAFLKNEDRMEALLLLYFLAMLVQALIERQVRIAMVREDIEALPLYPEERDCKAPTANRILEIFEKIQRHDLMDGEAIQQRFPPKLTDLQRDLMRMMGVPGSAYPGA